MSKYRTDTRDIAPKIELPEKQTPGECPDNRVPIYDVEGRRRGHVGRKASAATVARFGVRNAKLGKKDGREAWLGGNVSGGYGSAK